MTPWRTGVMAVLMAGLLSACAAPIRTTDAVAETDRQQWFAEHDSWAVSGRLGLSDGERGGQLSFRWLAEGEVHQVDLSTLTGGQRWQLVYGPGVAELVGSDFERQLAVDPDQLVSEAVGWPVPVQALAYWIRDLPPPPGLNGAAGDWALTIQRYTETEAGLLLPARLQAQQPPYRVRIALRDWQLPVTD